MRRAGRQKQDPLAGIEDMLSSLCAAQSNRTDFCDGDATEGQDENQGVQHAEESPSSNDEVPTTPEICTSPKPRQRRKTGITRRQNQSHGSKRIPAAKRIKKSQRGNTKRQADPRNNFQSTTSRDFVGAEEQDNDIAGTSSDDQENAAFLNQMKRLAEEHLNVNQQKNDAMNTRAVNAMKLHTDECVQRMKQIAGKVSSDIIRQATALEEALPVDINEESAGVKNAIKTANDGLSNLLSQAKSLEEHVDKLVHQVQEQRKENKKKHDDEEQQLRENAERIKESGEQLTSVLQQIDEMIDLNQFNQCS